MSGQGRAGGTSIRGTLISRLLVNTLVDPDEAAPHLPVGVRPHATNGGTIVGCCLLDIAAVRPAPLPATFGRRVRAVAHRFSVEWDDEFGRTEVGVYVPARHTDSRLAIVVGGRWFPGIHRPCRIDLIDDGRCVDWRVTPIDQTASYGLKINASTEAVARSMPSEPIGAICVGASIGLSPDRHGALEAARMTPDQRTAQLVRVDDLQSEFLAQFASAEPAPSYLMRGVDVVWTRAQAPRTTLERVSA